MWRFPYRYSTQSADDVHSKWPLVISSPYLNVKCQVFIRRVCVQIGYIEQLLCVGLCVQILKPFGHWKWVKCLTSMLTTCPQGQGKITFLIFAFTSWLPLPFLIFIFPLLFCPFCHLRGGGTSSWSSSYTPEMDKFMKEVSILFQNRLAIVAHTYSKDLISYHCNTLILIFTISSHWIWLVFQTLRIFTSTQTQWNHTMNFQIQKTYSSVL